MTKLKTLAMYIALVLFISLLACANEVSDSRAQTNAQPGFETFIVVEKKSIDSYSHTQQYIMYDPDTLVMYSYVYTLKKGGGLTVMYNADGTPKLYSPNGAK